MRAELKKATCFPQLRADLQQGSKTSSSHFEPLAIIRRTQLLFQATGVCDHAKRVPADCLHTLYSQDSLTKRIWKHLLLCEKPQPFIAGLQRLPEMLFILGTISLLIWKHPVFKKKALWLAWKTVFLIFNPHVSGTGRAEPGWHCIARGLQKLGLHGLPWNRPLPRGFLPSGRVPEMSRAGWVAVAGISASLRT